MSVKEEQDSKKARDWGLRLQQFKRRRPGVVDLSTPTPDRKKSRCADGDDVQMEKEESPDDGNHYGVVDVDVWCDGPADINSDDEPVAADNDLDLEGELECVLDVAMEDSRIELSKQPIF